MDGCIVRSHTNYVHLLIFLLPPKQKHMKKTHHKYGKTFSNGVLSKFDCEISRSHFSHFSGNHVSSFLQHGRDGFVDTKESGCLGSQTSSKSWC